MFAIGLTLGFTFIMVYLAYGFSDSGRYIRDHGIYASGITDDEVKSIWCGMTGFEGSYSKELGIEYCGEIKVKVKCWFTNRGDGCLIKRLTDLAEVQGR